MDSPRTPTIPRRRNGRPQACEPCRRRKVACDHALPTCSRCLRGNIASHCIYLVQGRSLVSPPPAGRSKATPSVSSSVATQHRSSTIGAHSTANVHISSSVSTPATHTHRHSVPGSPAPGGDDSLVPNPDQRVGYLGATSFSAVFQETQESLAEFRGSHRVLGRDMHNNCETTARIAPDKAAEEMGVRVLKSIPTKASCYYLLKIYSNPNDGWVRLAAHRSVDSLWETFGDSLEGERDESRLREMSLLLSQNNATPLNEGGPHDGLSGGEAWLSGFTGQNMRWETLGVLFTYWSFGTISLTENDATIECKKCFRSDRRRLWRQYKEAAWRCIELTRDSPASPLCAYLMYKHTILETARSGDASAATWRLMGETAATATFLGLHVVPRSGPGLYSVATEVRRRTFATMFIIDKVFGTFTGRPPLLGRRFVSSELPLDVSDETLLDEPPEQWFSHVDENGWNTEGKVYSTTVMRARAAILTIRDEILELALDSPHSAVAETSYENLVRLREKATAAINTFPSHILFSPNDNKDPYIEAPVLYVKLLIRLEHLGNLFFIERLMIKHHPEHNTDLLDISFEMVSLTLVFWTHKDRLAGLQGDFEWIVMSCAAPAGGILCTELLKPTQTQNAINTNKRGGKLSATRSSVIQQLSLLVGFLDWVGPTAPNGDLCSSTKNVIKHVLDVALNPAADATDLLGGAGEWDVDFSVDLNDFFNFELLDTFDWLRPEEKQL